MFTVTGEITGEYRVTGCCDLAYTIQPGDPNRGVEIGYAGGITTEVVEYLHTFRTGVNELIRQRASERVDYAGIDIVIEFLDDCSPNESCKYDYAFMYEVVEADAEVVMA